MKFLGSQCTILRLTAKYFDLNISVYFFFFENGIFFKLRDYILYTIKGNWPTEISTLFCEHRGFFNLRDYVLYLIKGTWKIELNAV